MRAEVYVTLFYLELDILERGFLDLFNGKVYGGDFDGWRCLFHFGMNQSGSGGSVS